MITRVIFKISEKSYIKKTNKWIIELNIESNQVFSNETKKYEF
jgi:hypothetical protein